MFVLWSNSCVTVGDTCDGIENFTGLPPLNPTHTANHKDTIPLLGLCCNEIVPPKSNPYGCRRRRH